MADKDDTTLVDLLAVTIRRAGRSQSGRFSQSSIAKQLDVSEQTVSRWFRGDTRPSDYNLERLRRLLQWTDAEYAAVQGVAVPDETVSDVDWRSAAGVPAEFPELPIRAKSSDLVVDAAHRLSLHEVLDYNSPMVSFATGHGISTVFDDVVRNLEFDTLKRRQIVVPWSFAMVLPEADKLRAASVDLLTRTHVAAGRGLWNADRVHQREELERTARRFYDPLSSELIDDSINERLDSALARGLLHPKIRRVSSYSSIAEALDVPENVVREQLVEWQSWIRASDSDTAAETPDPPLDGPRLRKLVENIPSLARERRGDLLTRILPTPKNKSEPRLRLDVRILADLSPTPAGRSFDGDRELLSEAYLNAAQRAIARLQATKVSVTLFLPRETADRLELAGDRIDFPHYTAQDFVDMIGVSYPGSAAGALRPQIARVVRLTPTMALTTSDWLLARMLDQWAPIGGAPTSDLEWNQDDFETALRGLAQLAGLPTTFQDGQDVATAFLAGINGRLPRRSETRR